MNDELKRRSNDVTKGPQRAPARAMMKAMGLNDEELPFAAEKINGKIKRLMRKKEAEEAEEAAAKKDVEPKE